MVIVGVWAGRSLGASPRKTAAAALSMGMNMPSKLYRSYRSRNALTFARVTCVANPPQFKSNA